MVLTVGFIDGFDHYPNGGAGTGLGILQAWEATGSFGPVAASFATGYRGRGQRLELAESTFQDGRLLRTVPDASLISTHIASSITTYDVDSSRGWVSFRNSTNGEIFMIRTLPTGELALFNGDSMLAHTAPITAQVAHRFNLWADITDPSSCDISLAVDGDRDNKGFHVTNVDAVNAGGPIRMIGLEQWGYAGSTTSVENDHSFDDIVFCIGAAQNIGELEVVTQGPTSDFQKQWTPSTGTDNFEMVNEIPPNLDTDYNASAVLGNVDLQNFPVLPTTPDNIFCVSQFIGSRKEESGTRTLAAVAHQTADHVGVNQNQSTSYDWYYQHYLNDPETLAAWLVAGRAATKFGYKDIA